MTHRADSGPASPDSSACPVRSVSSMGRPDDSDRSDTSFITANLGRRGQHERTEVNLVLARWCAPLHCQIRTTAVRSHTVKSQNKIIHRRDVYNVRRRSSDSNTAFLLPLLPPFLLLRVPHMLHLVLLQIPYPLPIKPKTASKWFPVRLSKSVPLLITLPSHP